MLGVAIPGVARREFRLKTDWASAAGSSAPFLPS